MQKYLFIAAIILMYNNLPAQEYVPYLGSIKWINGYNTGIKGESIPYTSAYPDYANIALLTRCSDGNKAIEWYTDPIPLNTNDPYVYFSWVAAHSTGSSKGIRYFDLYVNDNKLLTFATKQHNEDPNWTYGVNDSSRLVFVQRRLDGANDAHGINYLRLPTNKIEKGKPVKLKIVGQSQQSADWYMTFKFNFKEKIEAEARPFILKSGKQVIAVNVLHFGKPDLLEVKINNKERYQFNVVNGINSFDIPIAAVNKKDSIRLSATILNKISIDQYVTITPVIHRTIHLIHHSHTDIGYSHIQPDVLKIHIQNINDALTLIKRTSKFSEEAKFKWNIESLWVVENYLQSATPEQKENFISEVKKGNIELQGLYANVLTGLSEPEETFHYTDFADSLRKLFGVTINSAMISDIPGYNWTTVTALAHGGIKYFSSGPNYVQSFQPDEGDRVGNFNRYFGDVPVWWISPSGQEKILLWAGKKGYSSWHGMAVGQIFEKGPKKIGDYMEELIKSKYPYDMVQWRYNIVADNGPIDTSISSFVEQWNIRYASPKLVLSTPQKMFSAFEKKYGKIIKTVKGDISPYWEDGAASTAKEAGVNRINSLKLQQLSTLYSMINRKVYNAKEFYKAWRQILLFHEHTWGAFNSISEPDVDFVKTQWNIKNQFLKDGSEEINLIELKLIEPLTDTKSSAIAVCNTLSHERSGAVYFNTSNNGNVVVDERGKIYPLQKLNNGQFVFWAENLQPLSVTQFQIKNIVTNTSNNTNIVDIQNNLVANNLLSVVWDQTTGSITQLSRNNKNFAGSFKKQGLNSYWYVPGRKSADAISSDDLKVFVEENGPVLTKVSFSGKAPGTNGIKKSYTIYTKGDVIDIENTIDKKAIREKEAVHFGFPFNIDNNKTVIDAGYGILKHPTDQLIGSNTEFLCARRWMDVYNEKEGIQWMFKETPMIEPGQMIDEQLTTNGVKSWKLSGNPSSCWFSYAMNNYWHTNYKSDQSGITSFSYAIRPHGKISYSEIELKGNEYTQPLIVFNIKENVKLPGQLLSLSNPTITITSITPIDKGLLLRMYNPEKESQVTKINWNTLQPQQILNKQTNQRYLPDALINVVGHGVIEILVDLN